MGDGALILTLLIKKTISVSLDNKTIGLLDKYAENHSLSRSAVIRLIVNCHFLKGDGI